MVKSTRHPALFGQTGFLLKKVSTASFDTFSDITAAHGLHPMHFGMLLIIDAEEPVSQLELSRRSGVDPSSMVGRMDALDERGLVVRKRGERDRRTYEIRLSDAGRELLEVLRREAEEHRERFLAPLDAAEQAELHRLLLKLTQSLEEP